jgi:PAS domain S-box-containing protein
VLYLENNLAPHVFAPVRTGVLKLLASQAAISLENTRLYRDLAEREAKIRRLVDANIIGIVIWNLEGQILDANDAFLRMVGYDRKDLVSGRIRWTELTPTEWRDRDVQAVEDLKTIGTMQPFEKEYFRKDSSRVPVLIGGASVPHDFRRLPPLSLPPPRRRVNHDLRSARVAALARACERGLSRKTGRVRRGLCVPDGATHGDPYRDFFGTDA